MIIACMFGLGRESIEVMYAEDQRNICTAIKQTIIRDLQQAAMTPEEIRARLEDPTGDINRIMDEILNNPVSMTDWTTIDLRGLIYDHFWLAIRHVPEATFVTLDI